MKNQTKKLEKNLIKIVNKNLNSIYGSCEKTAKEWGKTTIPLNYLFEAIKIIKTAKPPKELEKWCNATYRMFDTLYVTCLGTAKKMNSKEIPLIILEKYIKILKDEYIKGVHGK